MNPLNPHNATACQRLLGLSQDPLGLWPARVAWFASDPSKASTAADGSTGSSGSTTTPGATTPKEDAESMGEDRLATEQNKNWIDKLASLKGRDAISDETAEIATKLLSRPNKTLQGLAKQLAEQTIDEETFEYGHEALSKGGVGPKRLGKALVQGTLAADTFRQAMEDIESADPYLRPLAVRLGRGDLKPEEYKTARATLYSHDDDEKWAAQMLAQGNLTPQAFKEKMAGSRQKVEEAKAEADAKDPVGTTQKDIHDKVMELLITVDVVMGQLPEEERTRPLKKLRERLVGLNHKDRRNQEALAAYLNKLQENESLSLEDAQLIRDFDASSEKSKAKEEFREFELAMGAMGLSEGAIKNVRNFKWEEWNIENDFLDQVRISNAIIKSAVNMIHYETLKERMLEEATKQTGIKMKPGTPIQYTYPDPEHGNLRSTTIKKVEVEDAPILDKMGGNVIGRQPANVRIVLDNGEEYNLARFTKWVNASDVHEVVKSQVQMEEALGLPQVGQRLKPGEKLEYSDTYERDSKGRLIPKRKSVGIVAMDDEKVVLEEPVILLRPEQEPSMGLEAPRMAREMNLGEFTKWMRRNDGTLHLKDAEELRARLKDHNAYLNKTQNRNPEEWPPITLKPGEVLQYGGDTNAQSQIDAVDDEYVTLKDGTKMTLPQFFGWVRGNDVERGNAEDEAKRQEKAAERLGEEVDQAAKEGFFARALKKLEAKSNPSKAPPGNGGGEGSEPRKSILELFDPYSHNHTKPYGPLVELYNQYTYISVMDLINLGKELLEFIKRKHTRRSKNRYSLLGKNLPSFLGTEFERVNQAAETEEVNTYKEAMSQWGTWQILGKLHSTNSKDEAKACFITLTEKGELRWDDMNVWSTLNRLTSANTPDGAALYIHLTHKPQINPKTGAKVSGEDRTKDSIDAMWGEGQWSDWFSKNVNGYNNAKKAFEYKGKQLEGDPKGTGGLTGELQRLLSDWKDGKYVNPTEYEELVDFGIKFGKMTGESKLFYLMEGLSAKCPSGPMQGMTLLHIDRMGELDGVYLNQFPMLDFFTNKNPKPFHPKYLRGEVKEPPAGGYKAEDFEAFIKEYFPEESKKCAAGIKFSKFLWEWMIIDPNFQTRLSKGLRRAENMDHDDAHMYIPPANMEQVKTFVGSFNGNQKYFTDEGYKNGYVGFNQYLVSLSNRYDDLLDMKKRGMKIDESAMKQTTSQMMQAVQSYFTFDSYLSGRRGRRDSSKAKLDKAHYSNPKGAVNDSTCTVGFHKAQLDNFIKEICDAYGIDWKTYELYNDNVAYDDTAKQNKIEANMEKVFGEMIPKLIEADPQKMIEILGRRKRRAVSNRDDPNALRGIVGSNRLLTKEGDSGPAGD